MSHAHKGSYIPNVNKVMDIDEDTAALFHYDSNGNDVINGVKPVGAEPAALFNQENYIAEGEQFQVEETLTMAAWVNVNSVTDDRGTILKGAFPSTYYFTISSGRKVSAYWYGKTPQGYLESTSSISWSTWTHVAVTWGKEFFRIYIDGVLDREVSCKGLGKQSTLVELGSESARRYLNGQIQDLCIWDIECSPAQINQHMNGDISYKNLIGFWEMNTGGSIITDKSNHRADLSINNGTPQGLGNPRNNLNILPHDGRFGGGLSVESTTINLWPNENGRSKSLRPYGTTPPTVELVNMNTPFGTEVWKVTIPANADSGFAGCRVTTDTAVMRYDGVPYSYFAYVSGEVDGITIYPTGWKGIESCKPVPAKDIGHWKYYGYEGYSLDVGPDATPTGTEYMAFYSNTKRPYEQVFYVSVVQFERSAWSSTYAEGTRPSGHAEYRMSSLGIDPVGEWTISGWFRKNEKATGWGAIMGMGNYYIAGESEFEIWTNHSNGFKTYSHDNRSGRSRLIFTPNEGELSEWFYVAVTHKGNKYTIYVFTRDRREQIEWTAAHSHPIVDKLFIGKNGNGRQFEGVIDEIRIDRVERSADEINAWYYANSPFYTKGIYRT